MVTLDSIRNGVRAWLLAKAGVIAANIKPLAIAFDNGVNVIVCTVTLQPAWPSESLSAHCWRAYRDRKVFGRVLMPPIDALFGLWQKPDPAITDENGSPITGHCRRAYEKTRRGDYLPPEYSR